MMEKVRLLQKDGPDKLLVCLPDISNSCVLSNARVPGKLMNARSKLIALCLIRHCEGLTISSKFSIVMRQSLSLYVGY